MKKIYKRSLLTFAATAVFAPTIAIVACSNGKKSQDAIAPVVPAEEVKFDNFKEGEIWTANFTEQDIKQNHFAVPQDGVYLVKSAYHGKLWDGTKDAGHEVTDNVARIYAGLYTNSVTELGDGDSLYVLYDNDDKDGFTPDKFSEQFLLNDTSIMNQEQILDMNIAQGNRAVQTKWGNIPHITFANGVSSWYIGSQSNHYGLSFDDAMAKIKTQISAQEFNVIQDYYTHASQAFVPVLHDKGMFTYERVSDKAYKVTYHFGANDTPVTAGTFKLLNGNTSLEFGTLSLGNDLEWNSYENSTNGNSYKFQARKVK